MLSQNQVLNKILATKDISIITKNNLTEEHFFNYRTEFNFILNHNKTYGSIPDKITFLNSFPDFDIVETSEPDSYLLEQLYRDYNQTYLASCFNNMRKFLETGDVEKAQSWLKTAANGQQMSNAVTCTDIFEDTGRYDRYAERTQNKFKYYCSTGLPELDTAIGGIDRENENLVIFSRPGAGKTQLLVSMGVAAFKQGLRVGIYEGEMTPDKIGYRIDTFLGHIRNRAINRGDIYVQPEYKSYIDNIPNMLKNGGCIKVLTPNDVPGNKVTVDVLRGFVEREQLDILLIDQYDLVDDISNTKVKHEKIGNIARDIKFLQVEKQIPIISVCQQNRTKNEENGDIDSTQIAGSDMISRYATVLLALEQEYNEANNTVEFTINIVKARDGSSAHKLTYEVNFDIGTFQYIPSEKDKLNSEADFQRIADSYSVDNTSYEDNSETNELPW